MRTFRYTCITATLLGMIMAACSSPSANDAVLLPVKDDPTISFSLWFKVGSQCDPEGKEGLAAMTAAMLTRGGTVGKSYEDILDALYPLYAEYGSSCDKEMTVISGRVHRDNLEVYYPLLTDALLHPGFREEDFSRIKSESLNMLEKTLRYSSDEELGKAVFYNAVYDGTNYGHLNLGTVSSLNSITLDDIRAFYEKWYTRGNIVIGIAGGYDSELPARLRKDLEALPEGAPVLPEAPQPGDISGLRFTMVEKECNATAISFGFPIDVLRGDDDFWALALFNSWFGEHRNSSSHLYQVIREARGMNYGDYSYIEIFPNGGRRSMPAPNNARRQQLFEVWLRPVQHEYRHFALRAAVRELQMVIENGMTQEQFELTQQFLNKYALHYATTTSERLGYAIDAAFYGLDGDYTELFRSKIEALTLQQVNDAIHRHLQHENMQVGIVTMDAQSFADDLLRDAPSPVTYSTPKPDEVLEEDKAIAAYPLKVEDGNIRIVPVDKIFN
ncbi:MAG: insulinase family protein [Ignavibacteria bacterium]|nr:MAG: insulinase family protein [Ignavibacteria bacterium]